MRKAIWIGVFVGLALLAWNLYSDRPGTVVEIPTPGVNDPWIQPAIQPVLSSRSVSLVEVSDFDTDTGATAQVAEAVRTFNPDYIITGGDNGHGFVPYDQISPVYTEYYRQGRFFPAMGNHDDMSRFNAYYIFLDGGRYYSRSMGDGLLEVFFINSNWAEPDGNTAGSIQGQWLQNAMQMSTAKFKIVILHEPPYASCSRPDNPSYNGNVNVRWPFAAWGADIVISGHCHNYERLSVDDIPYLVAGLGGGGSYGFSDSFLSESQVHVTGAHGFLAIVATESYLDIAAIAVDGQVIDRFQIWK